MPIFGYFWVFCPKSAVGWKSGFATIPEKLPGHLGIPIYHINHIWSHLPSLERCIRGYSEILDYCKVKFHKVNEKANELLRLVLSMIPTNYRRHFLGIDRSMCI